MSYTRRSLLKNKDFCKLWISQILSQLTIYIATFILINRVFTLTKSAIAISLIWLFWFLPAALVAPLSGFFIDAWDKRKILVLTNILQAITVASYLLVENHSYHFIYLLVFTYSLINQLYLPAEGASLPWLVRKEFFPLANSLFLLTTQFSLLFGFGVGGLLLRILGEPLAMIILSLFLLIAGVVVSFLPAEKRKPQKENILTFFIKGAKEEWQFITQQGLLVVFALVLIGLFQIITVTLSVMMPKIAEEVLRRNFLDVSSPLIFSLGIGLISGSYLFPKFATKKRKKKWVFLGLLMLGSCLATFFINALLPLNLRIFFTALILLLGGLASTLVIIPAQTFVQEHTPWQLRGKIFGLLTAIITLSAIPPTLFVAGLVEILGVVKFIELLGIFILGLAFYLHHHGNRIIDLSSIRIRTGE